MTDPKTYLDPAEEKMEMAVMYLDETLQRIRAGKANPKILEGIRVEYYGSNLECGQRVDSRRAHHRYNSLGESHVQGD